jgi:hypothetical protein
VPPCSAGTVENSAAESFYAGDVAVSTKRKKVSCGTDRRQEMIKLHDGKPASEGTILALEAELGCQLSGSFRIFLKTYDGAKPETNVFKIDDTNESGVNAFIPAEQIPKARRLIENIPPKGYPVAWTEGGNYVFLDEDRDGAVFFWDHEIPDEPTELASSFGSFLELLEPFDMGTVHLKPSQVKEVWVDPDFLRSLKK